MCWHNAIWQADWDYVKMLMKAPLTVKEQLYVCNGGTDPELRNFCRLALFPCRTGLHIWHTCSYVFRVPCCLWDAKEQRLSSEADPGGNLHPVAPAPTLSSGSRNVPHRGAGFRCHFLLQADVCANLMRRSAARKARRVFWLLFKPVDKWRGHFRADLNIRFVK